MRFTNDQLHTIPDAIYAKLYSFGSLGIRPNHTYFSF